ncbi:hypothetical protein [Chitinasiproducens palmae]|uniref:Uncharacterized protein n=1 Tax=Chitinasiproducens palmae TaxID=1770053 RepID=A0A1H2PRM3_9BURK|nr:hypothetical protein [Chitinasiproducens palmae]SDV49099.1 hypothetical protein SAMN05216551_10768 [Chitinasiproducens palmae]
MEQDPLGLESRKALLFALTTERLNGYYDRDELASDARARDVAAAWLSRRELRASQGLLKALAAMSDTFARELIASLSREAGLYVAHEMREALDPAYQSGVSIDMLAECERRLRDADLAGA